MRPTRSTQFICSRLLTGNTFSSTRQCSPRVLLTPTHKPLTQPRSFTTTYPLQKKGGKAAREASRTATPSTSTSKSNTTSTSDAADDPYDFSVLEKDIATAIEGLKTSLSKLRSGGRFNPEVLETLRVNLGKSSGGAVVGLGEIAQVVPKGRIVTVIVGEEDHIKPITSTIQSSGLNLTPQPDPQSPLTLNIPIPPPTAESRKLVLDAATKEGEKAGNVIRQARQGQQKKLRQMQLGKVVRPDDLKKAGSLMEKVVEKGGAEVKRVVEGARKALDS